MMAEHLTFSLDRQHKMLTGVCAGIARHFSISRFWIRLGFIAFTLLWIFTPLLYLGLYFLMSSGKMCFKQLWRDVKLDKITAALKSRIDLKKPLYRNTRKSMICGVCAGIADYLEVQAVYVRIGSCLSLFLFPPTIIGYFVLNFILETAPADYTGSKEDKEKRKKKPASDKTSFQTSDDRQDTAKNTQDVQIDKVSQKFDSIENKLRKIEATITSKKFKLHSEFKKIKEERPD